MAAVESKGGSPLQYEKERERSVSLNKAPQDFVVSGGTQYRVVRKSINDGIKDINLSNNSNSTSTLNRVTPTNTNDVNDTNTLRSDLDEAEAIMSKQAARIEELERFLLQNSEKLGGVAALQSQLNLKTQPEPINLTGLAGKSRMGLAARRRAESSQSTEYDLRVSTRIQDETNSSGPHSSRTVSTFASEADPITPGNELTNPTLRRSLSDGFVGQNSPGNSNSNGNINGTDQKGPPRGLAARLAMGSQERRRMASLQRIASSEKLVDAEKNKVVRRSRSRAASGCTSDNESTSTSDVEPYDNNSNSRPNSRDIPVAQYILNSVETPKSNSGQNSIRSTSPLFTWSQPDGTPRGMSQKLHLFIAHDNPQLGNTVRLHLRTDSSGSMGCMMETKYSENGKEITCFIIGDIAYSGPFEGIDNACIDDETNSEMQRGSQCLVCTGLKGYKNDIKSYPSRPRSDIVEIDITMGAGDSINRPAALHEYLLDSPDKLQAFLKPCKARVDVILDPSHNGTWYPYWEGHRKMAPQFRSRGIGYLRLGDDMSNYGSAFLSLDAGYTFMDDGATSITNDKSGFSSTYPGSLSTPSNAQRALFTGSVRSDSRGSDSRGGFDDMHANGAYDTHATIASPYNDKSGVEDSKLTVRELEVRQQEVREILSFLRDPDLKWANRSQHLQRLRDLGDCYASDLAFGSNSPQGQQSTVAKCSKGTTDMISVVTENILRQNNPHVLRAAISSLRTIADSTQSNPSCGVAWRALLLEVFHLLRTVTRQVYEEAKDTLDYLHTIGDGRRKQPLLNLTQLASMLTDIFGGPRGKGTPKAGSDKMADKSSNTCKVVQWFTNAMKRELTASLYAYATINTSSFTPSSYERVDTGVTLSRCKYLLAHREEITRDTAIDFISNLVVLDMVQQSNDKDNFLSLIQLNVDNFKLFEKANAIDAASYLSKIEVLFIKMTSAQCSQIIQDIAKESSRMYEKLLPAIIKQLLFCTSVLKNGGEANALTSGNISRNASNNSIPSYAIHNVRDRYSNPPSSRGSSREAMNNSREVGSRGGSRSTSNMERESRSLVSGKPSIVKGLQVNTNSSSSTSVRNISPRSPIMQQKVPNINQALPPRSPVDLSSLKNKINDQWFEARLMLRTVPATESAWTSLTNTTCSENANSFTETLSSVAESCGMARAKVLRIILPFDENTSSNDQAAAVNAQNAALSDLASKCGSSSILETLQVQAVNFRKTIRVKMADEADLQQAMQASKQLASFCTDVEIYSKEIGKTPISIVSMLE
jgi:hypothetical protein